MYDDGDIIGFSSKIDGKEFGEYHIILSQNSFMGDNWITYARIYLFENDLKLDRLFCVKERRLELKFRKRKGRFEKLPKDFFQQRGFEIV